MASGMQFASTGVGAGSAAPASAAPQVAMDEPDIREAPMDVNTNVDINMGRPEANHKGEWSIAGQFRYKPVGTAKGGKGVLIHVKDASTFGISESAFNDSLQLAMQLSEEKHKDLIKFFRDLQTTTYKTIVNNAASVFTGFPESMQAEKSVRFDPELLQGPKGGMFFKMGKGLVTDKPYQSENKTTKVKETKIGHTVYCNIPKRADKFEMFDADGNEVTNLRDPRFFSGKMPKKGEKMPQTGPRDPWKFSATILVDSFRIDADKGELRFDSPLVLSLTVSKRVKDRPSGKGLRNFTMRNSNNGGGASKPASSMSFGTADDAALPTGPIKRSTQETKETDSGLNLT